MIERIGSAIAVIVDATGIELKSQRRCIDNNAKGNMLATNGTHHHTMTPLLHNTLLAQHQ